MLLPVPTALLKREATTRYPLSSDRLATIILFALISMVSAESCAAGFDCSKAATHTEQLICSDNELQALDDSLAAAYRNSYRTSSDRKTLKSEQLVWLKQRDNCNDAACIRESYRSRIASLSKAKADYAWLEEYSGKSTNQLVWDKRFTPFVKSIAPSVRHDFGLNGDTLWGILSDSLGGPPDTVTIKDGRYMTFSACLARFCLQKGFVWVDLGESKVVAAVIHYDSRKVNFESLPDLLVFSRHFAPQTLPVRFKADLDVWLEQAEVEGSLSKFFISSNGAVSPL